VTKLFAAVATHVLNVLPFALIFASLLVFILIILAEMLREFTTRLFFPTLTAAPPNFSSIRVSMSPARPVEILLFVILLSALLAHLDALIDLALPTFELDDPLLHLLGLTSQLLDQDIGLGAGVNLYNEVELQFPDFFCHTSVVQFYFHSEAHLFFVGLLLVVRHVFVILPDWVPIESRFLKLSLQISLLHVQSRNQAVFLLVLNLELILQVLGVGDRCHTFVEHIELGLNDFIADLSQFFILIELEDLILQIVVQRQSDSELFRESFSIEFWNPDEVGQSFARPQHLLWFDLRLSISRSDVKNFFLLELEGFLLLRQFRLELVVFSLESILLVESFLKELPEMVRFLPWGLKLGCKLFGELEFSVDGVGALTTHGGEIQSTCGLVDHALDLVARGVAYWAQLVIFLLQLSLFVALEHGQYVVFDDLSRELRRYLLGVVLIPVVKKALTSSNRAPLSFLSLLFPVLYEIATSDF
jgi:hypothetical protein